MNDTIALLQRRRSAPPAIMTGPGPTAEELATILTIASRVPDHGKLAPWRFIVFEGEARQRAGRLALGIRLEGQPDLDEAGRAEELNRFARAPVVVGVVSRAAPHVKIPEWEQVLSSGAASMIRAASSAVVASITPKPASRRASPAAQSTRGSSSTIRTLMRTTMGRSNVGLSTDAPIPS